MSKLISRNISKYLDGLVQNSEIVSLEQCNPDDLMGELKKHFEKFNGEPLVEYERDNNFFNSFLKRWSVSNRTPMDFREVGQIPSDGSLYLSFSTDYSAGGYKYFHSPMELAFIDDVFYLGLGVDKKEKGISICHQNLYVPVRKIESLDFN